jgi:hypothetical protein
VTLQPQQQATEGEEHIIGMGSWVGGGGRCEMCGGAAQCTPHMEILGGKIFKAICLVSHDGRRIFEVGIVC